MLVKDGRRLQWQRSRHSIHPIIAYLAKVDLDARRNAFRLSCDHSCEEVGQDLKRSAYFKTRDALR